MNVRQIYRDDWLIVVDKPCGLPTQPDPASQDDLYSLLTREHGYVGLHHRLDRPASGLVLLTLQPQINATIAKALRAHGIERIYRAVLAGDALAPGSLVTWDAPLDGQQAATDITVEAAAGGLLAVACRLRTGRTHQIRRHAALAGAPVIGDRRHGGDVGGWWPRLALHGWRLALDHPVTGERLQLEASLPVDFAPLWERAGGP